MMFWHGTCPYCTSSDCRVSRKGSAWLRTVARLGLVRQIACRDCYLRFWRVCLRPPVGPPPNGTGANRPVPAP